MTRLYKLFVFALIMVVQANVVAQTYTFTTCGATGRLGPTQTQVNTSYTATNLAGLVTSNSGVQVWTVPVNGQYSIEAFGAEGGGSTGASFPGGKGSRIKGTFNLTQGTVLNIVVGQAGASAGSGGSGGGGSFVYTGPIGGNGLLIAAGGGGGGGHDIGFGGPGSSTSQPVNGGGRGNGGYQGIGLGGNGGSGVGGYVETWNSAAAGGAGWGSDGLPGYFAGSTAHQSFPGTRWNGGNHGSNAFPGGFGGGGGAGGSGYSGGGGGGYTGGGGGNNWPSNFSGNPGHGGGQGGGSYNSGTDQVNTAGVRSGSGLVTIVFLGNSINTSSLSASTFCQNQNIIVAYIANGTYSAGNIFTAQLSNASGSFTSPVNIGSVSATASGSINATIPSNTPAGTGYRVRVVSGNPVVTGSDNGSNITIEAGTIYYADADGDGFGDAAVSTLACSQPQGYVTNNSDCDDTKVLYLDADVDGFGSTTKVACGGVISNTDCNDDDASLNPNTIWYLDADDDGYHAGTSTGCTSPGSGYKRSVAHGGGDCNDNPGSGGAAVNPGTTEICNGIDDDCDGVVDDGFINTQVSCPVQGSMTKNLASGCAYTVNGTEFNATVSENCGPLGYTLSGATTGTGTSLAGVTLNVGTTTITWSATKSGGQAVTCTFSVTVVPPVPDVTCPDPITVPAEAGKCEAVVHYNAPSVPPSCPQGGNVQATTVTFTYTGQIENWTVPQGVTSIKVKAWGAQGGNSPNMNPGGLGGYAEGDLSVSPGELFYIYVGEKGQNSSGTNNGVSGSFNGGGSGGSSIGGTSQPGGAAGGGASDLRRSMSVHDRVIVAAGGGGAGGGTGFSTAKGGNGGGLVGSNGTSYSSGIGHEAKGGAQIFTQNRGTYVDPIDGNDATNGTFGYGGNGDGGGYSGGGGGGGGYYGGGGGSSHFESGGGGGSSYIGGVLNGVTTGGINTGHGKIEIEYSTPVQPSVVQTAGFPSGSAFPVGTTTNTFEVTDAFGQKTTCSFTVTVNDEQAPAVTQPADITEDNAAGVCEKEITFSAQASDNCGISSLKYYLNYGQQSQQEITSPRTFAVGSYGVSVVARDAAGNQTVKTFTITVRDAQAPTLVKGVINSCYPSVAAAQAAAIAATGREDNCTAANDLIVGASTDGTCTALVTVTVTDAAGNSNSVTYNTKIDATKPVLSAYPANVTVSCVAPAADPVTATDNCDGNLGVVQMTEVSNTRGNDPSKASYYNYVVVRKWSIQDGCGNTEEHTQEIIVQDITAPDVTCPANKVSVPFDFDKEYATILIGTASATDNCAPNNLTITNNNVITNNQYPLGTTTVKWTATDPSSNASDCNQTIEVRKRNTAVTYSGTLSVQYSDIINLSATLTDNEGAPVSNISGRSLIFELVNASSVVVRTKTATTNASGVAQDTLKVEQAPGSYTVRVRFTGDAKFNSSQDNDGCTVNQENSDFVYSGSSYFTTPASTNPNGTVVLSTSINDRNDGDDKRGDIRKAKVTFSNGNAGAALGTANNVVGLVNPGVLTEGISTTSFGYTLNNSEQSGGGKIWEVWTKASDHYTGEAGPNLVTLALPGQDYVTGGGHYVMSNSAGTYAGTAGAKMNFGFTMKWNKSGQNLQGQINVIFRKLETVNGIQQWKVYQIKSNAINSMSVRTEGGYSKAVINTKANLTDVTNPLATISLGGGHDLTLEAWDHTTTNGGSMDKIGVRLIANGTGNLLFASSWSVSTLQIQFINGGNINARNSSAAAVAPATKVVDPAVTKAAPLMEENGKDAVQLDAVVYPNPTMGQFNVRVQSSQPSTPIQLRVSDVSGRVVLVMDKLQVEEVIPIGNNFKAGVYFIEVLQGKERKLLKVVKM